MSLETEDVDVYEQRVRTRELFWRLVWLAIVIGVAIAAASLR